MKIFFDNREKKNFYVCEKKFFIFAKKDFLYSRENFFIKECPKAQQVNKFFFIKECPKKQPIFVRHFFYKRVPQRAASE